MKASFKANFNIADIKKMYENAIATFDQAIINRLALVGEKFVKNARTNGSYKDRTGNLRSSIKYFILKDGEIIGGQSFSKNQPSNLEQEVIGKVSEEFPKGYVLVGLAGMEYAAAVESKNYDVITSSAITAESDLKKSLDELRKKLSRKK